MTHHIKIIIRDNGAGISPEYLTHIFEKFYRIDSAGQKARGSGLGLAMLYDNFTISENNKIVTFLQFSRNILPLILRLRLKQFAQKYISI